MNTCKHANRSKSGMVDNWTCRDCGASVPPADTRSPNELMRAYHEYRTHNACNYSMPSQWIGYVDTTWTIRNAFNKLMARYVRFSRYAKAVHEQRQEWKEIERISYADNSIEAVMRDKNGNVKRIEILGPGGDACF